MRKITAFPLRVIYEDGTQQSLGRAALKVVHRARWSQRLRLSPLRQNYFHKSTKMLFTFFTVDICTDDAQLMV